MKSILYIYSIVFLSFGNVLFSNIHYLHDHSDHSDHVDNECYECINFDNNNNLIHNLNEIKYQLNQTSILLTIYFSVIKTKNTNIYLSRAPPIS